MKVTIAESLKRLRSQRNITQRQLSAHLNVSHQAVSRWENDTTYPDIELLPEIALFFEISVDELLGLSASSKD